MPEVGPKRIPQEPGEEKRIPEGWYFHAAVEPEQLTHLKEGETYRVGLPCDPKECFTLDGYSCCIYIEDGIRKAAYFMMPDRFYPMDPWFLDWGDIGGVCYAHKTHNVSFNLNVALKTASTKNEQPRSRRTRRPASWERALKAARQPRWWW
jgi:hypothetical protein